VSRGISALCTEFRHVPARATTWFAFDSGEARYASRLVDVEVNGKEQ